MSGSEIVGVVLAAFPLLIGAVQTYERGLEPLTTLFYPGKFRRELKCLNRQICTQRDLLELYLAQLLSPAISASGCIELFNCPNGPAWYVPTTAAKLKAQLETRHHGCLIVFEDMNTVLKQPEAELGMPRIKFSIAQSRREKLLDSLQRYNDNLQSFAQLSQKTGSLLLARGPDLMVLKQMRLAASNLYEVIAKGLDCKSGGTHGANLRLESLRDAERKTTGNEIRFRVLFELVPMPYAADVCTHWKSRETDIRLSSTITSHSRQRAIDICSALSHIALTRQDIPFGEPPKTGSVHFMVQAAAEPRAFDKPQSSIRLSQILGRPKSPLVETSRRWYTWHRAQVAVTLACAVLQFGRSPWLGESWGSDDIQLIADGSDERITSRWQPFVARTFQASSQPVLALDVPSSSQRGPRVRNKELYALSLVLLELAFNVPLKEKRTRQDVLDGGQSEALIDYYTAARLIDNDLVYETGPDYTAVVRRCLYGFDLDTHDLDSETFHAAVCGGIISPLEKNLELRAPPGWSYS